MSLTPGTKLGPYEILTPLGAGGMGEVYRARDSRLDRTVAIKLLPESFAQDAERLRRFDQEARVIAALNHPNLMAIFDVGAHQSSPYLVSELLEGETLRERLKQGPISPRKAGEYALQIAQGLAAAHDRGIIHRDLKPDNLFITAEGRVKILDFGLAKLAVTEPAMHDATATHAGAATATAAGMVLGTVGYMSPEQVRGAPLDHRSDVFSFGAVLYEMLTGERAFKGESGVETMSAILKADPPELKSGANVSPGLERIVRHCLEKNPAERFQSAHDLAFALSVLSGTTSTIGAAQAAPAAQRWQWVIALAAVLVLAVVALIALGRPTDAVTPQHFAIIPAAEPGHMAISPDGSMLAYVATSQTTARGQLFLQRIGAPTATPIAGTTGASYPFWSADSSQVAFFSGTRLYKVSAHGGTPQVITTVSSARGGAWNRNGVILYAPDSGGPLWQVREDGSGAAQLTALEEIESSHRFPVFLPDGESYLYYGGNFDYDPEDKLSGIYLGKLGSKDRKLLVNARSNVGYADPGFLFYVAADRLMVQPFDPRTGTVQPNANVFADKVGFQPQVYWGSFTVSRGGNLVYGATVASSLSQLVWFDRSGTIMGQVGETAIQSNPALSPSGTQLALDITDFKTLNTDVWIHDLGRRTIRRFTFGPAEETTPSWSPDGQQIIFRSSLTRSNLLSQTVSGLRQPETLAHSPSIDGSGKADVLPTSWLPGGDVVLVVHAGSHGSDVLLFDVQSRQFKPFLAGRANESQGQFSPNKRWVAYTSDESGSPEVYVTSFPGAHGKWQVSRGGGSEPRWSPNGKELFFIAPDGTLLAAPVLASDSFSSGTPVPLFKILARAPVSSTDLYNYTVAPDGKRFLVNRYVPPSNLSPFSLVLNATAGMKR